MQHDTFEDLFEDLYSQRKEKVSRKDFIKICSFAAGIIGLPLSFGEIFAKKLNDDNRPSVIWLHFQECTGCTESILRSSHPDLAELIFDIISLDYHETLMAAAGHQAEKVLSDIIKKQKGKYLLVVEGSIPVKDGGIYCQIAGETALSILNKTAKDAAAIIAIGSCASWGGVQSAPPNPTGAKGVPQILKGAPVITLPGCPPNPYNLLATIIYLLSFGKLPKLDSLGRPKFAYSKTLHNHCERKAHFDSGRYVKEFGDIGHQKGWCLYLMGCKGPVTYANCNAQRFNEAEVWPVSVGSPCYGCTNSEVGFKVDLHKPPKILAAEAPKFLDKDLVDTYPVVGEDKERGQGSMVGAAVAGAAIGVVAGFAGAVASKLSGKKNEEEEENEDSKTS